MQTVAAGLYPGRQEIAVDILVHVEQIFDKVYFMDAFSEIFQDLDPAKAIFGSASESPNISALLDIVSSIVAFDMAFSTGMKVENALSVLTDGVEAAGSLFIRLNNLGVFAEAAAPSVDLEVFPGVTVENGNFLLSAGVRLAVPFEGEVTASGDMASGIEFSYSLTTIAFKPYGQLAASLPFKTTINGSTQSLSIKFEDDNLFDEHQFLVKVDFPVCPVISIVDGLLGKLGSLELSAKNILGPVETAGLDLANALDDYFPKLAPFVDGILEGMFSDLVCSWMTLSCLCITHHLASDIHIVFSLSHSHFFFICSTPQSLQYSKKRALSSLCRGCRDWRCWPHARRCDIDAGRGCFGL